MIPQSDRRHFLAGMGAVVLSASSATAELPPSDRYDGFWWIDLHVMLRLGFIMGFVDSARWSTEEWQLLTQSTKSRSGGLLLHNSEAGELATSTTDFTGIAYGQLVDGISVFYEDFRNKRILIATALSYVRDQIRGKSADKLQQNLEVYRQFASRL